MSADALFKAGKGAQGLALAAVIALGVVGVLWVLRNREKFDPTSDKNLAYQAASGLTASLTGVEGDTLGTALHRAFTSEPAYFDEAQALKTCRVVYASKGVVTAPICVELISKYGP